MIPAPKDSSELSVGAGGYQTASNGATFCRGSFKPFREGLVIAVECMFSWYRLADLCLDESLDFILGHAPYMKATRGGKNKNDRIDSEKIARLMRGGTFPLSYVYATYLRVAEPFVTGS